MMLYSHTPLAREWAEGARVRHGNMPHPAMSTAYAQACFGRWSREDRADVFWSPRHHLPAGLGPVRSVVTIHDLVWRMHPETMIRLGRLVEAWLMPRAVQRAARLIAVSHATANDLVSFYPHAAAKTEVIAEACDLPRASTRTPPGPPYFLFVGTLEPRKNLARVLAAFARLGGSPYRLVVAGNPGWKNAELVRTLKTSPGVEWVGHVDDETLSSLYAGAYCVVAPSLYEGFGLQIVEAFAFGVPVITSNVSSLPEVAGDAALLVDPHSIDAVAAAMRRMRDEPGLREALAARASRRSFHFSWDRSAEALLAVFETVHRGG